MEDRLLYRVTEVAVFLNVSRSKVYELLASGDLRSVKIDRTRLVRGSDLRDYVESLGPEASHSVRPLRARSAPDGRLALSRRAGLRSARPSVKIYSVRSPEPLSLCHR